MAIKQRNQVVVLIVLVAVLCGVGAVMSTRPKRRTAPSPAQADPAAEQTVEAALPPASEMVELIEWLAGAPPDESAYADLPGGVFGLKGALAAVEPREPATAAVVPAAAPFVEPPTLEGILWCGGQGMAVIEGETYRRGQKVKDTAFKIVEVGISSVRLSSSHGQELRLDLLQ